MKETQSALNIYSIEEIKNKIHTLRSQFRKDIRNIKQSSKSGSGSDDIYHPKLWCFDDLQFLQDGDMDP